MSRSLRRRVLGAALPAVTLALLAGCAGGGATPAAAPSASVTSPDYALDTAPPAPGSTVQPNPYEFGPRIDNPWLPLVPGTRMRYVEQGRRGARAETVTVTRSTRMVAGVVTTVVQTSARRGRRVVGAAEGFYAQDIDGNVWLFGRDRRSGSGAAGPGSWLAGVRGATPVIVMPAVPRPGSTYDEGDPAVPGPAAGVAAGRSTVLRIGRRPAPPEAHGEPVLESAPVGDHGVRSYYAEGVGLVRLQTPGGRLVLVRTTLFD